MDEHGGGDVPIGTVGTKAGLLLKGGQQGGGGAPAEIQGGPSPTACCRGWLRKSSCDALCNLCLGFDLVRSLSTGPERP